MPIEQMTSFIVDVGVSVSLWNVVGACEYRICARRSQSCVLQSAPCEARATLPYATISTAPLVRRTCTSSAAVVLSHVSKVYDKAAPVAALRDVSLSVADGERLAVMGPSGSGKSTLLNLIGGLDVPVAGSIVVRGVDLAALNEAGRSMLRRSHVAYVFQAYHLLPTLTCEQNVAMPLYLQGVGKSETRTRVQRALADVGLTHRATHVPDRLSGGERQRAAVARAIVTNPSVLLADEPTGNLDTTCGRQILELLRTISDARGAALIIATHDPAAASLCNRVVCLRDGRIDRTAQP